MAEALLRHHGGDRFESLNAGTDPHPIHPLTLKTLQKKGVNTEGLQSKNLTDFLGKDRYDHLIIVCDGADKTCPAVFPGIGQRLLWPFEDPAGFQGSEEHKQAKFREVCDTIEARIVEWLNETA